MPDVLSPAQLDQFVERGFVKVPGCFSRDWAIDLTRAGCERLFCDLDDPATWPTGRIRPPQTATFDAAEVAPLARHAACELVGGAERMVEPFEWTDNFVANFGREPGLAWSPPGPEILPHQGWHADGDFFRHFLDSPEQGLLVIALFSDVAERGGATQLACDSVAHVSRFLADHPEGVLLHQIPADDIVRRCTDFVEATGEIGDVYFVHPHMIHTWSPNELPVARFITNPPVTLRAPMRFDRDDPTEHSPVERGVLRALGVERHEFVPTGQRGEVVPERLRRDQEQFAARRAAVGEG